MIGRFVGAVLLCVLLMGRAEARAAAPPSAAKTIKITGRVSARGPANFMILPQRVRNLTEVVHSEGGKQIAYLAITSEQRSSHAEAVGRILDIANEAAGKRTFVEICGWPALERIYAKAPVHTQGGNNEEEERAEQPSVVAVAPAATVAIAEADSVVRFEGRLQIGVGPEGLTEVLGIAHSATCSANPGPNEPQQTIHRLTQQLQLRARPADLANPPRARAAMPSRTQPSDWVTHATAMPAFASGPKSGEMQIATANFGQSVVIGSNGGTSYSSDYGDTFKSSTVNASFKGDPMVGTGATGNIYLGGLNYGTNGCFASVGVSTDSGKTFSLQGNAAVCPYTGSICVPDQPQMAVDSFNKTHSGDQLYVIWRNFGPDGSANCVAMAKKNSGFPLPFMSCSIDGGKTWINQTLVGSGDLGRITVSPDGFVYVTYISGANLEMGKFSSCAAGLQSQPHFPLAIASFSGVDCPINGLFNTSSRCASDLAASPQPAVTFGEPGQFNHVYVAYAEKTSDQNDDIVVRHSSDGGVTWPDRIAANSNVNARRFMPWVCANGGYVNVGWYDRRAATAADNSLTSYYFNRFVYHQVPPLLAVGEQNVSITADSEQSVSTSGDPKFGDYNGMACTADRAYLAWASATPPPGVSNPGGVNVYSATLPPGPPFVTSVSPSGAPCGGGTTNITISGSNFYNVTNVSASGQQLQNVRVLSNTQITATVPAGLAPAAYEILVQTPAGSSSQLASAPRTDLFGIGPVVTGISPSTGSLTGGTMVTITGSCFNAPPGMSQNAVQVYFGPNLADKGFDQCQSATQCVVASPAATTAGNVDVTVNVAGAASEPNAADQFSYAGPVISILKPNHGPKTGGTWVEIDGSGFPPDNVSGNNMVVWFGSAQTGAECLGSPAFATSACLTTTPAVANARVVDVVARAFGLNSPVVPADQFIYDELPQLDKFQYGIVSLNGYAPGGGTPVEITSSDPSVVQVENPILIVPAGQMGAAASLMTFPTPTGAEVTLTATYQGMSLSNTFLVSASPALQLSGPTSLAAGGSALLQIGLNQRAPAAGLVVKLSSSDPSAIAVPAQVTVPAGQFTATLNIVNQYSGRGKQVTLTGSFGTNSASDTILVPTPTDPCKGCKTPERCCLCAGGTWTGKTCM